MSSIAARTFYVLRGGIPWRLLPKDLPPKSTIYGYFSVWRDSGLFVSINHHFVMLDRERAEGARSSAMRSMVEWRVEGGREASPPLASPTGFACRSLKPASPSAAVLDSQSVKTIVCCLIGQPLEVTGDPNATPSSLVRDSSVAVWLDEVGGLLEPNVPSDQAITKPKDPLRSLSSNWGNGEDGHNPVVHQVAKLSTDRFHPSTRASVLPLPVDPRSGPITAAVT